MVLTIDIVIFGITIVEDVELIERNLALLSIFTGLFLRLIFINISSRTDDLSIIEIFLGIGFTDLFHGDFTYLTSPLKRLINFQGPFAEILISFITAYFFPLIATTLTDFKSFQSFIFKALTIGYSANIMLSKFSEYIEIIRKNYRLSRNLASLFVDIAEGESID